MYKVIVTVIDSKEMKTISGDIKNDKDLDILYKLFKCKNFAGTSGIIEGKECYIQTGLTNDSQIVTIFQIKL